MIAALSRWWRALSRRERTLVAIALALAAPLLAKTLIITPLRLQLDTARAEYNEALNRHAAISARVAILRNADQRARVAPDTASVNLLINQRAADAGQTLSRNDSVGERRAAIAIPAARAPALLGWLAALENVGITPTDLSLRRNGDGTVALTATLGRAQ